MGDLNMTMLLFLLCLQYGQGLSTFCTVDPVSRHAENAALKKHATQISTYQPGTAWKAVDGNKNPRFYDGSCSHTDWTHGRPYQWWMVDLESEYRIDSVSITNRLTHADRLRDFDIFVSLNSTFEDNDHMTDESLCIHVSGGMGSGETRTFACNTTVFGQFVQIYMETLVGRDINICEVTVEGYQAICIDENTSTEIMTQTTALAVSSAPTTKTPGTTSVATTKTASASTKTTSETTINSTELRQITPTMSISSTSQTTATYQAVSATSLASNNTTTATPTCQCSCDISSNTTNMTQEALVELIKGLRKELEVNKKETSISKRKLISAVDERQSAEAIGFVGVLALCVPVLLIVSFDLINLWSLVKAKRSRG